MTILKTGSLLLLCTTFFCFSATAQWTLSPSNALCTDIDVVSTTTAYMSGELPSTDIPVGYIYKTTDGGATVTTLREKPSAYYKGVYFFNDTNGFVVGSESGEGTILKTTNGGTSWTKQVLPELYLHGVYFINAQVGFVYAGFGGVSIYKTTDGGTTWRLVIDTGGLFATNMQFLNAQVGFLSTSNGILKTVNAGETWQLMNKPSPFYYVKNVWFLNESVGFSLTGFEEIMYRTSNGGVTWEAIYQSQDGVIMKNLKFVNNLTGFVLQQSRGDNVLSILKTTDGGNTWQADFTQTLPTGDFLSSFDKWDYSGNTAMAVGLTKVVRNPNFTANLNLSQPTALLTGSAEICPNSPARLRLDFTGSPPYSFTLRNQNGTNTPLSNITSNPYFHTITASTTTTYTIDNFKANTINGQVGGRATIKTDFPTSAELKGGDNICFGENTKNMKLILRGCPPFTVKLKDRVYGDSVTLVFQQADTVNVVFRPNYATPSSSEQLIFEIESVIDGNGQAVTNLSTDRKYFSVFPLPTFSVAPDYPRLVCPDAEIDLGLMYTTFRYGYDSITVKLTNRTHTLYLFNEPVVPLTLRESNAPLVTVHTSVCGNASLQLDTIKVRAAFPTPANFRVRSLNDRGVELTWTPSPDETVVIQRRTTTTEWERLNIEGSNLSNGRYFDATASQGKTWYYTMLAGGDVDLCPSLYTRTDSAAVIKFFDQQIISGLISTSAAYFFHLNQDSLPDILQNTGRLNNIGHLQFSPVQGDTLDYDGPIDTYLAADIDNDGDVDYIDINLTAFGPNTFKLLINRGNHTFNVTRLDSLITDSDRDHIFSLIDYNNDGWIDLMSSAEYDLINYAPHIWLNNRNGSFRLLENHPFNNTKGHLFFADYDNDGDLDAALYRWNNALFYRCEGYNVYTQTDSIFLDGGRFTLNKASWQDVDSDGDLDLFVPNTDLDGDGPILCLRNNGNSWSRYYPFGGGRIRWSNNGTGGTNQVGDYNNDGALDFIFGGQLMLNRGLNTGFDAYSNLGLYETLISLPYQADLDRDGDLDLTTNFNNVARISENKLAGRFGTGNWLEVNLEGRVSNRSVLGAIIRVKAKINNVSRWQIRYYNDDKGNDLTAHFGLGNATSIDSLIVQWPSGKKTILTNQPINKYRHLIEDSTITNICTRLDAPISAINNVVRLCNQAGSVKLTTTKAAGESIKWYRGIGNVQLVSTKDTLVLSSDLESDTYTAVLRDTMRGCPAVTSAQPTKVTISRPTVILDVDSLICGSKWATILLSDSLNNGRLYSYYAESFNSTTGQWVREGVFEPSSGPLTFNRPIIYRITGFANNDSSCRVVSKIINIKGSTAQPNLLGKVTLGTRNTPSVNSRVWLYLNRILVDSTRTDANGAYIFIVNRSAISYQVKAASSDGGYKTTFFGGVETLSAATSLQFADCENRVGNIALLRHSLNKTDLPYPVFPRSGFRDTTVIVKLIGTSDSISQAKNIGKNLTDNAIRLKVFPNPFSEKCTIEATLFNEGLLKMTLFNNFGQVIIAEKTQHVDKGTYILPIENAETLAAGIYIVQLSLNNTPIFFKIVKMN